MCWYTATMHTRMVAILFLALAAPALFAETNAVPAWPDALTALGIQLDPEAATRASMLAAVQTADAKARLLDEDEWQAIQERQDGLCFRADFQFAMTNGLPVVTRSANTNLLPGDIVIGVGTNIFASLSRPEAQTYFRAGAPAALELSVLREGQTNLIEVALESTQLDAVDYAELLVGDIAYLAINGLFPKSAAELVEAIQELNKQKPSALILDLRGAGGIDAAAAAGVAALFSPAEQFLFALRDLHNEELARYSASAGAKLRLPVIVLINQQTRGAAEILSALLAEASPAALLLGEPTAGDFGLRKAVELDNNLVLLSTRVLDTAGGHRYDGRAGLEPAIALAPDEWKTYDYDPPEDEDDRRETLPIERLHQALRQRTRGDAALERAHDILAALKTLNEDDATVSLPTP
jgi:C-terminal processing protease CtpA/Prc